MRQWLTVPVFVLIVGFLHSLAYGAGLIDILSNRPTPANTAPPVTGFSPFGGDATPSPTPATVPVTPTTAKPSQVIPLQFLNVKMMSGPVPINANYVAVSEMIGCDEKAMELFMRRTLFSLCKLQEYSGHLKPDWCAEVEK